MILYDDQFLKYFRYGQSVQDQSEYPSTFTVVNTQKKMFKFSIMKNDKRNAYLCKHVETAICYYQ